MYLDEPKPWPSGNAPSPKFCGEGERLDVLASYRADQLDGDAELARIARFAARLCNAPIATVSLVEEERQRFLAREGIDVDETPRSTSFCAQTMLGDTVLEVLDATQDQRFSDYASVTGDMHVRYYAGAPLISPEGAPLGALCVINTEPHSAPLDEFALEGLQVLAQAVMRRLSGNRQQVAAKAAIERSEGQFHNLADSIPDIAWSADREGNPLYFNSRFYEFTGRDAGEIYRDILMDSVHPDERDRLRSRWNDARESGRAHEAEFRLMRSDGKAVWMLGRAVPVRGSDGEITGWFGTVTDVDEGHRLSESRELIAKELAHRIKNIFAVVSGLITLRTRGKEELESFGKEINATIRTLGRAQDFIRPLEDSGNDDLIELLEALMKPYASDQVSISGDAVPIGQRVATPLALVFHELATNTTKYGALSGTDGQVSITVECQGDNVDICWEENGGPATSEPETTGFGMRLTDTAVRNQLGGTITREWRDEGLAVHIAVPSAALCPRQK